jgi:hypothetical protein
MRPEPEPVELIEAPVQPTYEPEAGVTVIPIPTMIRKPKKHIKVASDKDR